MNTQENLALRDTFCRLSEMLDELMNAQTRAGRGVYSHNTLVTVRYRIEKLAAEYGVYIADIFRSAESKTPSGGGDHGHV